LRSPDGELWTFETFTAGAKTSAVWSEVELSIIKETWRLDAEYYQPHLLKAEKSFEILGWPVLPLGNFIQQGYRVVYENTEILLEDFDPDRHVYFLQASDLLTSFPTINQASMGWVDKKDWDRYSHGRIRRGEILVEVKGKAEKVAIVPDDFQENVLVTGTLYKMLIDKTKINPYYILVYLLSSLGRDFRDRVKSNLLISYVSKDELYSIPVPVPPDEKQNEIANIYLQASENYNKSQALYAEAEALLTRELGLDQLDLSQQLTYEANFSTGMAAGRLDAEYFQPKYQRAMSVMGQSGKQLRDFVKLAKRRFQPQPNQPFEYIEIGSLNGEGIAQSETIMGEDAPSRAQWIVKKGDLITSMVRPIRRLSALIETSQNGYVCSSGFAVFEPHSIEAELLLVYLRLPIVCEILDLYTTASMYPAISTNDLMNIPVTLPAHEIQKQVVDKLKESRIARQEAKQLLEDAKRQVERMILGEAPPDA
jgi:restriction endonuclease S subunit